MRSIPPMRNRDFAAEAIGRISSDATSYAKASKVKKALEDKPVWTLFTNFKDLVE